MITIIDLEIGNIASVSRALKFLKIDHKASDNLEVIKRSDKLIFPGVGSFFEAAKRMKINGLDAVLRHKVLDERTPILGICLGMQLFATYGEEGGGAEGLDFIKGRVSYHRIAKKGLCLPHIGWNDVHGEDIKIIVSVKNNPCFYFVHSYELIVSESVKVAYCHYGVDFVAAVQKDHIIGVQFHPEKSQKSGLALLKNFCEGRF